MKTPKQWIRITNCENIPLREGRAVKVDGKDIALFNLGDRFLAVDNRCPHRGGPLADGIVSGTTVVCPLHAWKVDLECGSVTEPANTAVCLRTFRTRVEDGEVLLEAFTFQAYVDPSVDCGSSTAADVLLPPIPEPINPAKQSIP
jgi:nitrite reductase (NADH) small subunit